MSDIGKVKLAQVAMAIDCEGCIRIHLANHGPKSRGQSHHILEIAISNTDPRLVEWCKGNFGGCIKHRSIPKKATHAPEFKWVLGGNRKVCELLTACYEYLILKKEQADIAFAFWATMGRRGKPVSPELFGQRDALKVALSQLKTRGSQVPAVLEFPKAAGE